MLPVPDERLLHLGNIGAENIALRRGDLLRDIRPGGQLGEVQILFENITAVLGDEFAKVAAAVIQLDRGNADDRTGDAHSGVVTVHFANGTIALLFVGLVVEHERVRDGVIGHDRHGLGCGLGHVALRDRLLRDGVLAGFEVVRFLRQCECPIGPGNLGCGETPGAICALYLEGNSGHRFVGACFKFFDSHLHGQVFLPFLRHSN